MMFGMMPWGGGATNPLAAFTRLLMHFDGTAVDECGHATSLNSGAAISSSAPKFGSGNLANIGGDSHVAVGAASDLQPGNQTISFECWVKPAASLSGENSTYYSCCTFGDPTSRLQFWHSNRQLRISCGTQDSTFTIDALPNAGEWTHLWFWVDKYAPSGQKVGIHLGGVKLSMVTSDGAVGESPISACDTFTIGAWKTSSGVSYRFNGSMDEARLIIGALPYDTSGNITPPSGPFSFEPALAVHQFDFTSPPESGDYSVRGGSPSVSYDSVNHRLLIDNGNSQGFVAWDKWGQFTGHVAVEMDVTVLADSAGIRHFGLYLAAESTGQPGYRPTNSSDRYLTLSRVVTDTNVQYLGPFYSEAGPSFNLNQIYTFRVERTAEGIWSMSIDGSVFPLTVNNSDIATIRPGFFVYGCQIAISGIRAIVY
jgi:hypothetical protein